MADNQNTITTVFKADISNFSKSTQDLNRYIGTVNSEFQNAVAGLDNWSRSQDGLTAKITQLNKILEAEKKKLGNLESAYAEMVAAGKENTAEAQKLAIAINNQSAKVTATEKNITKYSGSLQRLKGAGVETQDELDELNKKIEENGKQAAETSGKFGGFVKGLAGIGAAAVGVVGSFVALAESTREFRNEMAKLETAFQATGHTAGAAEKTYNELYAVLGDEGRATEAAQQLAQLSKNEKDLAANTRVLTGVLGVYGDSIPTEGLAEGMAATAAMGEVQGVLADALEWQGVNLEEYNAQLATMSTEEERAAHIQKTLTDLYGEAADAYAENNAVVIEANKAQAELTDATAELGEVAEPINSMLKRLGATLIKGVLPYIKDLAGALKSLFSGDISGGAKQIGDIFDNLLDKSVNFATGLVSNVAEQLPKFLPKIAEVLSSAIQKLASYAPQLLETAKNLFLGIVQAIPPTLTSLLSEAPKIVDTILGVLSEAIPTILSAAESALGTILDAIPSVLSLLAQNLPKIIGSIVNFLIKNAPQILESAKKMLMKVVDAIPSIVSSLASNLPQLIASILSVFSQNSGKILSGAVSMLGNIVSAIPEIAIKLLSNTPQIIAAIVKGLAGGAKAMFGIGKDLLKGLWEGMISLKDWIWKKIKGFFNDTLVGGIKALLGISSPSKVFAQIGEYSAEGYLGGFADTMKGAKLAVSRVNYAGAVGVAGTQNAQPMAQRVGGNTYNFYQTFEKMESSRYALHRAKVETLNAMKLAEA